MLVTCIFGHSLVHPTYVSQERVHMSQWGSINQQYGGFEWIGALVEEGWESSSGGSWVGVSRDG